MSASSAVVTFMADGRLRSIDVQHVAEAFRAVALTRVPRAGEAVAGAANLRGQVVTVLEAGRSAPAATRRELLLLEDRRHALAVEAICGLSMDAAGAEPFDLTALLRRADADPASTMRGRRRAFAPRPAKDTPSHAFVGVVAAGQTYALPFDRVLAVTAASNRAPQFAGRELAVVDLGRRLGLQSSAAKIVIVVRTASGPLGVRVDATTEAVRCRAEDMADAPDALNREGDTVRFMALARRGGRWLPVIDLDALAPDAGGTEAAEAAPAAPVPTAARSEVLTFTLGDTLCGVFAAEAAEIIRLGRRYGAPNLPSRIAGVIGHRGAVVPVARAGRGPLALIVRSGGDSLALPVDAVVGFRAVAGAARDAERAGPWNAAERRPTPEGEVLVFRPEWLMEAMRASTAAA